MSTAPAAASSGKHSAPPTKTIYLVSYPKIIFMYPTLLMAFFAGLWLTFRPNDAEAKHFLSTAFLFVFAINLTIFSFDFPRTTSLTVFFFLAAAVMGVLLLFKWNDQILPALSNLLKAFQPEANATFYMTITGILSLIYVFVLINVQFDYWEVTPNELLHHHGLLSNLERFSAPNLKIDKEINDVFEYMLLRSGRLILHPSNEPRAIVLENVLCINAREAQITGMLGALQVKVVASNARTTAEG